MRPYIHAAKNSSYKDYESHNLLHIPKIYPKGILSTNAVKIL